MKKVRERKLLLQIITTSLVRIVCIWQFRYRESLTFNQGLTKILNHGQTNVVNRIIQILKLVPRQICSFLRSMFDNAANVHSNFLSITERNTNICQQTLKKLKLFSRKLYGQVVMEIRRAINSKMEKEQVPERIKKKSKIEKKNQQKYSRKGFNRSLSKFLNSYL